MSFLARITIDGEEMNVLECSFKFRQGADANGRPSEKPKGGQIKLLIESTAKTDFLDWVISDDMAKDGAIVFTKRENVGSLKKLAFKDAYCLEYEEIFDAVNKEPLKTYLVLSARELSMNGTTFSNNWPAKAS